MEKEPIKSQTEQEVPILPLTQKERDLRKKMLEDLLLCAPSQLRFFIFWRNKYVISVGIKGIYFGMWLFDANSQTEIQALTAEGVEVCKSQEDLILKGKTATIKELNRKLPAFIKKYYPQIS